MTSAGYPVGQQSGRDAMEDPGIEEYLQTHEIDVPQDLFEEELRLLLIEDAHSAQYRSFWDREFPFPSAEEKRVAYENLKKIAFRRVKTELLTQEIIKQENFKVTAEELTEEAERIAQSQGVTMEQIKDFFGEDLAMLKRDVLTRKAEQYMRTMGSEQTDQKEKP